MSKTLGRHVSDGQILQDLPGDQASAMLAKIDALIDAVQILVDANVGGAPLAAQLATKLKKIELFI